MIQMTRKLMVFLSVMLAMSACSATYPGGSICTQRTGLCFDSTIDGKPVVPIQSREKLHRYINAAESAWIKSDLGKVDWTIIEPIAGDLDVRVSVNQNGANWFGNPVTAESQILPLNGQKLKSRASISASNNVRVEGSAAVTSSRRLAQDRLPSGDYLIRIRVNGPGNWDLKSILLTVK